MVHVLGSLNYGGVESVALGLIRRLREQGFSQAVLHVGELPGERETEFRQVAHIIQCPYSRGDRPRFIADCARALRAIGPDRVLAYNFGNHAMVALAARLAGVPATYVQVAGSPMRDYRTRYKSMVLAHLARPFCRGEIAVSESVRRQLVSRLLLPPARVRTIPNGCDVEEIRQRAAEGCARRRGTVVPTVVMVSRMDDAKDHPTLLAAAKLLLERIPGLRVTLVGDGPRRAALEHLRDSLELRSCVAFLGSRSDVPEILGATDVLVHATHTEGCPNVLIEAMAAEVPVVASDIEPCREVLGDGRCGLLVPPRDPAALASAVARLLGDSDLRQELVRASAERVRACYDIRTCASRYAGVLSE